MLLIFQLKRIKISNKNSETVVVLNGLDPVFSLTFDYLISALQVMKGGIEMIRTHDLAFHRAQQSAS